MKKTFIIGLSLIVIFGVGFCTGAYVIGSFNSATIPLINNSASGVVKVHTLNLLRENKIKEAIEVNEMLLDGTIADFVMTDEHLKNNIWIKEVDTRILRNMKKIFDYRQKYPRLRTDSTAVSYNIFYNEYDMNFRKIISGENEKEQK